MTINLLLLNLLVLLHVVWAILAVVLTVLAFLGRLRGKKWLYYYVLVLVFNVVFGSVLMHFPLQVAKLGAQLINESAAQLPAATQALVNFVSGYATVVNDLTVFIVANALMAAGFTVSFARHLKERGMKLVEIDREILRIMALALILILFSTIPFLVARAQMSRPDLDCTGLVDLNYLVDEDYVGSIAIDPIGATENGTGYMIYRKGHTINISAPHAESGEVIWVRR